MPWELFFGIGAAVLLAALFFGWLRSRKQDDKIDPNTPGDDPSKGMNPKGPTAS